MTRPSVQSSGWALLLVGIAGCTAEVVPAEECTSDTSAPAGSNEDTAAPSAATGDLSLSSIGYGFSGFVQAHSERALVTLPWNGERLSVVRDLPVGDYRILFVERLQLEPDPDWYEFCDEQLVQVEDGATTDVNANPLTSWWYADENRCGAPYGQ